MGQHMRPTLFGRHLEALLEERGVGVGQLAENIHVTREQVIDLIAGKRILTADVALLLGEYFQTSPLLWLELQRQCSLESRDRGEVAIAVMR